VLWPSVPGRRRRTRNRHWNNLFKMLKTRELDLVVGGRCDGQTQGRRLWKEPLVWAFSADAEVPKVLPLAFFPEPCPYREAALRALAGSSRRWHIACTSSSLAGVRAACMAGLAVTPLPKHAIRPGLRVLGKTDKLPILPEVEEYVSQTNETDTRQIIASGKRRYLGFRSRLDRNSPVAFVHSLTRQYANTGPTVLPVFLARKRGMHSPF
jgi:DNA-binding transcriptional LysR family regulator